MQETLETTNVTVAMISELENENLDLRDYAIDLYEAACTNSPQVFANHDSKYAAVALSILFHKTEHKFCLIVDRFKGDISNDIHYISALTDCLERGVKAEILTLKQPNQDSIGFQILNKYREKDKSQVKIKVASQKSIDAIRNSMKKGLLNFDETHNLGVFDDNKYRLEYMPSDFKAFVSMNNSKTAAIHRQTFDEAFSVGKDYPIAVTTMLA